MTGVHVGNLPTNVDEKQIRLHFSNPRNGGGRIDRILFPLPHGSAVVIYVLPEVIKHVLEREHTLDGTIITVTALPRKIYRRVIVELEKPVSEFISLHSHVVDELQYIGDLKVDFRYDKESYVLAGSWYQMEWALQYIDSTLEAFDFDTGGQVVSHNFSSSVKKSDTSASSPAQAKHDIKNPNIPCQRPVRVTEENEGVVRPKSSTAAPEVPSQASEANASLLGTARKTNKNKNAGYGALNRSISDSDNTTQGGAGNAAYVRLDDDDRRRLGYDVPGDASEGGNDEAAGFQNILDEEEGSSGSDDDMRAKGTFSTALRRSVQFSADTDFDEGKRRPMRRVPERTSGIDVGLAGFEDVPLTFSFDASANLKVLVAKDDITKQTTDAIVNPTGPDLSSTYGVSRAIMNAAGYELMLACNKHVQENGALNWSEVIHTSGGGSLDQAVGFILHTASPRWDEKDSESVTHILVCTYINCLQHADKLWLQSIALPLISAGAFGFPLDVCVQAFYDALLLFTSADISERHLHLIHLICFDEDTAAAVIMILQSLIDCNPIQAMSAAVDRYNTRYLQYNFAAEGFQISTKAEETEDMKDELKDAPVDEQQASSGDVAIEKDADKVTEITANKAVDSSLDSEGTPENADFQNGKGVHVAPKGTAEVGTEQEKSLSAGKVEEEEEDDGQFGDGDLGVEGHAEAEKMGQLVESAFKEIGGLDEPDPTAEKMFESLKVRSPPASLKNKNAGKASLQGSYSSLRADQGWSIIPKGESISNTDAAARRNDRSAEDTALLAELNEAVNTDNREPTARGEHREPTARGEHREPTARGEHEDNSNVVKDVEATEEEMGVVKDKNIAEDGEEGGLNDSGESVESKDDFVQIDQSDHVDAAAEDT